MLDTIGEVIQDLHDLLAHDANPQHKVVYAQCLQALLKVQAGAHQAANQSQQANPRSALLDQLSGAAG